MLGCISSGSRPAPLDGVSAADVVANGFAANACERREEAAPAPSSTAVAYGAISRSRRACRNSTRLDHSDESVTHSSSEPCCEDHGAVSL